MSKSKQIIVLSIIGILLFTFIVIISCAKNGTESSVVFDSGEYIGTYSVERFYGMDLVLKTDTVKFKFTPAGLFTMRLLIDTLQFVDHNQDRDFCDVTGSYEISSSSMNIEITYRYVNVCDTSEVPADTYNYYSQGNDIVFRGEDSEYDRRLVVWLPEE
ncbi:MAG: hypothetical protein GY865_14210 [candidate division Zixibacteria bacterium]|nr:hypothetical protein [candidate division Zixibacteria bacterium]